MTEKSITEDTPKAKRNAYQKTTKPCDYCGKLITRSPSDFKGRERIYCSRACKGSDWQKRFSGENSATWSGGQQKCVCDHCGIEFMRQRRETERTFCSRECQITAAEVAAKVLIPCDWCGVELEMRRWEQNRTPTHFCNRQCMSAYLKSDKNPMHKGEVIKECVTCGATIARAPSGYKKGRVHFCSISCRAAHQRRVKGVNHPNWRGGAVEYYGDNWGQQRRAAIRRDDYRCQRCKRYKGQEGVKKLDVHHIKPFRAFGYIPGINDNYKQANDLSNLITLCVSCHSTVEPRLPRRRQ